jgi:hypothetical protein
MSSSRKLRRTVGNYVPMVLALARHATPGTVNEVRVEHDDSCRIFRGKPCDCDPRVTLVPVPDPERN